MSYVLLSDHIRVARKSHRCIWCGQDIEPGQKYHDERSVYDDFQHHHWHPECRQAAILYFRESNDGEFPAYEFERGTTNERSTR